MVKKKLTNDEAKKMYDMLNKIDVEMNNHLEEGNGIDVAGDVSYKTVIRNKYKRFLKEKYNIDE